MTTTRRAPSAGVPGGRASLDSLIDRLEQNLAGQLMLARSDDFEALSEATDEAGALLVEAGEPHGQLSARQVERLSAIIKLHHQIGLTLAEKRREAMQKLVQGVRGKKMLKAYRHGR